MSRRLGRPLRRAVAIVAGLFALTSVVTARPGDPGIYPPAPGEPRLTVYVIHNGYHTELALPSELVSRGGGPTAKALRRLPASPWVMAGWGDAEFYVGRGWSFQRVIDAVVAALPPGDPALLRLTPLSRAPDRAFKGGVLRVELSPKGAERMLRRLDGSFRLQDGEPVEAASAEDHGAARYFESVERFGLPMLCNNWTGELLDAAGLPTTPALHLPPQGVMLDLRRRRAEPEPAGTVARARDGEP
ncbi:MAG: DUF2459 domain-containing protein [Phenylobacterium sp.]|uniref:DUF2459 domain-containing protein n=1 Tax=Phenylobacterium sp. TaxID=1871053 RepID=UPI0027372D8B|nr:DUF2459 domain-containing protein [Phenylobacterium sp.]MDP3748820.1 DUF2459 domain-containing protein [Phenylobacterium sp.]